MKRDPVCGMEVEEKDAVASLEHGGKTYLFCAESCRDSFVAEPGKYNNHEHVESSPVSLKLVNDNNSEHHSKSKNTESIELPISGMSCASCVAKVEKGLAGIPGVSDANVNFASNSARITFDPAQVQPDTFIKTIADLGYETRTETVSLPVAGMTCASCVNRVQKTLASLDGVVEATVNFATEKATVSYLPSTITVRKLVGAVEDLGYQVPEIADDVDPVEREKVGLMKYGA